MANPAARRWIPPFKALIKGFRADGITPIKALNPKHAYPGLKVYKYCLLCGSKVYQSMKGVIVMDYITTLRIVFSC